MRTFNITQTGPAIGSGEISYLAGEESVEFYGGTDTITQAVALIISTNKARSDTFEREPFTINYIPWEN